MRRRRYSDPGERGQGPKPARRQRDEREAARRDRGRMKRKQEGRSRSGGRGAVLPPVPSLLSGPVLPL